MRDLAARVAESRGDGWRIVLIKSGIDGKIGSYGIISNAPAWMVLIADGRDQSALEAAMAMERLVLQSTAAGVGTCWVGGTFRIGKLNALLDKNRNEKVLAVVPFGIPKDNKSMLEKVMTKLAHSKTRKPFDSLFSATGDNFGPYREALEAVRLAPSAVNAQPWRAHVDGPKVTFSTATDNSYTMLDMGIALCHFSLVAEQQSLPGHLKIDIALPHIATWQ